MAQHGTIKNGGGSNVRSAVYPEMGGLKAKPRGLARPKPFRGPKNRTTGR